MGPVLECVQLSCINTLSFIEGDMHLLYLFFWDEKIYLDPCQHCCTRALNGISVASGSIL